MMMPMMPSTAMMMRVVMVALLPIVMMWPLMV